MTITADMTFGEIALLPEFAGFGEHLMLCRPSTWERMWNKPIAAHLNSDTNPYEVTRVLRGLNRIVELADDGRQVAYDIWDEAFVTKWKVFPLLPSSTMRAITCLCCHTG